MIKTAKPLRVLVVPLTFDRLLTYLLNDAQFL